MADYLCSVRVRLPRPLFRRLMARAILERIDVSAIVVRAVQDSLPQVPQERVRRRRPRAPR